MITDLITEMIDKKRRTFPCHTNRASSIGFPCERYCVYCRTNWEDRKLPDIGLQFIFSYGNDIERIVLARMTEAGMELTNQQRDYHDRDHNISGHLDTFAEMPGVMPLRPVEIKSMSPYIYATVNSVEDMMTSKYAHVRKYPCQIMLYLYLSEYEVGSFVLFDKLTSQTKDIEVTLDYEYIEGILQKAARVNEHVDEGTLPDRIGYDPDICDRCDFAHICLPPVENRQGLYIEMEPAIALLLDERAECSEAKTRFAAIDKEVKEYAKKRDEKFISVGDWLMSKKARTDGAIIVKIDRVEGCAETRAVKPAVEKEPKARDDVMPIGKHAGTPFAELPVDVLSGVILVNNSAITDEHKDRVRSILEGWEHHGK